MKKVTKYTLTLSILMVVLLVSCKEEYEIKPFYETNNETITEYLESKKDTFDLFQRLIQVGDLKQTLAAYNPFGNGYTLFLPSNEAIEQFVNESENYSNFQELLDDQDFVNELVRFHVVNTALNSNDFPFGALPDTTLSGDLLTIGFIGELDALVQEVNNHARILNPDIYLTNGYVHIIDEVLKPITLSSYDWLKSNSDYTVFTSALELTKLNDTLNLVYENPEASRASNTLFVESNEVFKQKGILSVDDLISRYSPDQQDYTNSTNGLYQFVAYHLMEGRVFLNSFEGENTNFTTFANFPVSVNGLGVDLKINAGVEIFDTIIAGSDTTYIDYISLQYEKSNVITMNGAIHFIDYVMELYRPSPRSRTFQFFEEPLIVDAEKSPNRYEFKDPEKFNVLSWQGADMITYVKSVSDLPNVSNNDYLEIEGDFSITYTVPRILPGNYLLRIRANADDKNNAFIQVFIDDKRIGGNFDLTSSPNADAFYTFNIGQLNFTEYEKHQIRIQTLIPGKMEWDIVVFQPINSK